MDARFVCERCGTKWFVRDGRHPVAVPDCGACGGALRPFEAEDRPPPVAADDPPPGA
jgi:hypothetical protein